MLIEAKAREQKPGKAVSLEQLKVTSEERRTRLPVWVGMALTALFAYVKEATGGAAAERAPHDGTGSKATGQSASGAPEEKAAPAISADRSDRADHQGQVPQHLDEAFSLSDEPPLTVFNPARHFSSGFRPLAPQVLSTAGVNDNRYHVPAAVSDASAPLDQNVEVATPDTRAPSPSAPAKANRAPTLMGPVRLGDVVSGQVALLTLGDLLLGAHDADGNALHVSDVVSSSGQLHQDGAGWTLSGLSGQNATVTISYDISDGEAVVHQTAQFHVVNNVERLSAGADTYSGSAANTHVDALDGDDVVNTGAGADTIFGNAGNDQIHGGAGNDVLLGGVGDDVIYGGPGDDVIRGGDGNDRIAGEDGNDFLTGDDGNDTLSGGAGNDLVFGGSGNDVITGDAGNDGLDGGEGQDTLDFSGSVAAVTVDLLAGLATGADIGTDNVAGFERVLGGSGGDQLYGGPEADTLLGGGGSDTIDGGRGNDTLDGGAGIDTLDYSYSTAAVRVDLKAGVASGADIGLDTISGFEQVAGGAGNDLFIAGMAPVAIAGGAGEDSYSVDGPNADVQIVDFAVGDRIRTHGYEVMDRPPPASTPQFGEIYADVPTGNLLPIKVHSQIYDGFDVTVLEARSMDGGDFDIHISVYGHHDLVYLMHPIA